MLEASFFVHLLVQLVSQGWNLRHLGREAISSLPFGPLGWAFSKLPQNYFFLLLCSQLFLKALMISASHPRLRIYTCHPLQGSA